MRREERRREESREQRMDVSQRSIRTQDGDSALAVIDRRVFTAKFGPGRQTNGIELALRPQRRCSGCPIALSLFCTDSRCSMLEN